jgi:hypothetical protein
MSVAELGGSDRVVIRGKRKGKGQREGRREMT